MQKYFILLSLSTFSFEVKKLHLNFSEQKKSP